MSEVTQGSGAPSPESGATGANSPDSGQPIEKNPGSNSVTPPVENSELKRALDDLHRFKKEALEYKKLFNQVKDDQLKKDKNFESLYETSETSRKMLESGYIAEKKEDALRAACIRLGIRAEAESDLNQKRWLDSIQEELTTEGRVLVHGAEQLAEEIKRTKPHWFKTAEAPKFNPGGNAGALEGTQELTADYMIELQRKDRKKYLELIPKFQDQLRKRKNQA